MDVMNTTTDTVEAESEGEAMGAMTMGGLGAVSFASSTYSSSHNPNRLSVHFPKGAEADMGDLSTAAELSREIEILENSLLKKKKGSISLSFQADSREVGQEEKEEVFLRKYDDSHRALLHKIAGSSFSEHVSEHELEDAQKGVGEEIHSLTHRLRSSLLTGSAIGSSSSISSSSNNNQKIKINRVYDKGDRGAKGIGVRIGANKIAKKKRSSNSSAAIVQRNIDAVSRFPPPSRR